MTTSTEKHQGSVRSSDDLEGRRRADRCQTNQRPESPAGGELDRRELLEKAGEVGAGAVAAGALAGGGEGRAQAPARAAPPRGGRIVWGLESDPAHVAPFGGILTANHWAKEFTYDSLVEWDREAERQARARREVRGRQQDARSAGR